MSIPLDRLYHYIESLCSDDILIYRWYPHGSKKLDHLVMLDDQWYPYKSKELNDVKPQGLQIILQKMFNTPAMICHDQEPLDYNLYTKQDFLDILDKNLITIKHSKYKKLKNIFAETHLRSAITAPANFHKYTLLCHSEKNSQELKLYENNNFLGVYYWSHALIAKDWYRFAEYDKSLIYNKTNFQRDFLIYNRAWNGTREYRLKFAELLGDNQLLSYCNTKFNPIDTGLHYTKHQFKNSKFKISREDLENIIPLNSVDSVASGDYVNSDYQQCAIEVVLETLFDDERNHLTEKTLRPIACGKPFILASTPNSLEYLRDYGFKTFHGLIDESYDKIVDPLERLQAISQEMKRISLLGSTQKSIIWQQLHKIAEFNKTRFFSKDFHNTVTNEFVENFNNAIEVCKKNKSLDLFKLRLDPTVIPDFDKEIIDSYELELFSQAKQQITLDS